MTKLAVVVNPTKFADVERAREELARELRQFGIREFAWLPTTAADVGTGQARKAVADGAEMVLSWGGDGTVRAVSMGLLETDVPIGILPGGTGNLVAKNLRLPKGMHGALAVALGGSTTRIDVNEVDLGDGVRRLSILMCGMGLDAAMMDLPEQLKATLGSGAYVVAMARHLLGGALPISIQVDDEMPRLLPARAVLVANFARMQMGIKLINDADATDGELSIIAIKLRNLWEWNSTVRDTVLRRRASGHHRLQLRGRRVELRADDPWPREIDGDLVESGDYLAVKVLPSAIKVRVR